MNKDHRFLKAILKLKKQQNIEQIITWDILLNIFEKTFPEKSKTNTKELFKLMCRRWRLTITKDHFSFFYIKKGFISFELVHFD